MTTNFKIHWKRNAVIGVITYQFKNMNFQCTISKRRPWSSEEDDVLLELRQQKKIKKWTDISDEMSKRFGARTRSEKQCRDRYENYLKNKKCQQISNQWSKEDDQKLLALYCEMGNKWSEIAKNFPYMNGSSVKNKFYSRMRKAMRTVNMIVEYHFVNEFTKINLEVIFKLVTSIPPLLERTHFQHQFLFEKKKKERQAYLNIIHDLMEVTLHNQNNYRTKIKMRNALGSNSEQKIKNIIQFLIELQKQTDSEPIQFSQKKRIYCKKNYEEENIFKSSESDGKEPKQTYQGFRSYSERSMIQFPTRLPFIEIISSISEDVDCLAKSLFSSSNSGITCSYKQINSPFNTKSSSSEINLKFSKNNSYQNELVKLNDKMEQERESSEKVENFQGNFQQEEIFIQQESVQAPLKPLILDEDYQFNESAYSNVKDILFTNKQKKAISSIISPFQKHHLLKKNKIVQYKQQY